MGSTAMIAGVTVFIPMEKNDDLNCTMDLEFYKKAFGAVEKQ
jgi:hypothetical protein